MLDGKHLLLFACMPSHCELTPIFVNATLTAICSDRSMYICEVTCKILRSTTNTTDAQRGVVVKKNKRAAVKPVVETSGFLRL